MATSNPITFDPAVEYRDVEGFPGYRVGSDGSVWSCLDAHPGKGECGILTSEWRRLRPVRLHAGHLLVRLSRKGKQTNRSVHTLVLETFVGPRPPGMEACHFPDRNPANNRLDNLRWDTALANKADMVIHGTRCTGVKNGRAKLNPWLAKMVRRLHAKGMSRQNIADLFGVGLSTIARVINNEMWT